MESSTSVFEKSDSQVIKRKINSKEYISATIEVYDNIEINEDILKEIRELGDIIITYIFIGLPFIHVYICEELLNNQEPLKKFPWFKDLIKSGTAILSNEEKHIQ